MTQIGFYPLQLLKMCKLSGSFALALNFLLTWISLIFLHPDQSKKANFGILGVNSLSPNAKVSTRLTLSVCQQRSEFLDSKAIQSPVKTGAEFLKGGQKSQLSCGWFEFAPDDSESELQTIYKTCQELSRGQNMESSNRESSSEAGAGGRIVGGQNATKGQFPSIVSMGRFTPPESGINKLIHTCGGIILDKEWVLTARHCVTSGSTPVNAAVAGEHQRSVNESTEQNVGSAKSWWPRQFNSSDYLNHDIALVKVSPPFTFNEFVAPASLPPAGYEPSGTLEIAGWGYTKVKPTPNSTEENEAEMGARDRPTPSRGNISDILQFTPIPIVGAEDCRAALGEYGGEPNLVCTGFEDGHANSCFGDSGGPIYATIDGKVTVVGVSSYTLTDICAEAGKPNVYMKVSFPYYIDWIKKTMEENS